MISTFCIAAMTLLAGSILDDGNNFGRPEPLPRTEGAIRIACYNVENLFDHFDDPGLQGEFDDKDLGISDERARNIAAAIIAVDADIVALQEIESLEALTWFRDTYLPDAGYDYLAAEDVGYYRGIENAVMSRFEIVESEVRLDVSIDDVERPGIGWTNVPTNTDEPMTVQRSPLRVEIVVDDDYSITLFSVHHKSGNFKWKREAEAIRNNEWISDIAASDPAKNIMVMGDFNSAPWDKAVREYLKNGFYDIMAHRTISGEEGRLWKSHRSDRVIDFVLLNSAALREVVVGSPHIVGTYNPPRSWNWRRDPYPAEYASDHYPLVFDLIPEDRK